MWTSCHVLLHRLALVKKFFHVKSLLRSPSEKPFDIKASVIFTESEMTVAAVEVTGFVRHAFVTRWADGTKVVRVFFEDMPVAN